MFDSEIAAKDLISELKSEIDVAIPISNESYVESLNSLEQLLYTEVIKEQKNTVCEALGTVDLSQISVGSGEKSICFEDIYAVYDKYGVQLKKTTLLSSNFFSDCWYKDANGLGYKCVWIKNKKPSDDSLFKFNFISEYEGYSVSCSSRDFYNNHNIKEIIIPSKHNGIPVNFIHDFADIPTLETVIISDGVKYIDADAFSECNLILVEIPESVEGIDETSIDLTESPNVKVRCREGSAAEAFCDEYNIPYYYDVLNLIYFVRPALKTVNSSTHEVESGNVMLPVEFIDLAKAKLRADAYKIANEDAFAAKWMNDYNVLLETFKVWVESKRANFGF